MFIYKITNKINNKVYIGQTIRPVEERFKRHLNDATNNVLDTHFARAIRKYGKENFSIEIIDTALTQEELTLKEQKWIQLYNSVEEGYNETDAINKCGGNTYKSKSDEEKEIIKEKIRLSKIGGKNPHATKIKCRNVKTNEEIYFDSMAEGMLFFSETNHQFISRRCLGTIKNLYKGEWEFAYQDQDYGTFTDIPNSSRAKPVEVINLETQEKQIFNTSNDADRYCGFNVGYTSKKFKKSNINTFVRNNYQISLID